MSVDPGHIQRVLDAFDQEEWDEIHLVTADAEIHLIAAADGQPDDSATETSHASPSVPPADPPAAPPLSARSAAAPSGSGTDAGLHSIAAPTPGFFWRAPSPGAPPFTNEGERVERGATLCIVELMKLMNTLTATVTGTVVEICARNGEQVEAGQVLFRIRQEGPPGAG